MSFASLPKFEETSCRPATLRDLGQAQDRFDVEVEARPDRRVVDDHRQVGGVGDRREMAQQAIRARLVVHRRHRDDAVGLGRGGVARPEDRARRVVSAGARDHRDAAVGRANDRGGDGLALVARKRRRLAGRSAGNEEVDTLADLPVDQLLERTERDAALVVERRHERRAAASPVHAFTAASSRDLLHCGGSGGANRIIVSHPGSRKKTVSTAAGPRCPRCHRPLAAWRLNHCVYCGEAFPEDLKDGHAEPDALKWVERPGLPAGRVEEARADEGTFRPRAGARATASSRSRRSSRSRSSP